MFWTKTPGASIREGRRNRRLSAWRTDIGRGGIEAATARVAHAVRTSPSLTNSPDRSSWACWRNSATAFFGRKMVRVSTTRLNRRPMMKRRANMNMANPSRRFGRYSSCFSSGAERSASSRAPRKAGTSASRPARTSDQPRRRACWPMTSMRVCGHVRATRVASLKEVMWRESWGVSFK